MSLSTYYLEYGRHVARLHRRRRRLAYAPTGNTAGHDNTRKSIHGFPLLPYMGMGLRLATLRAAGALLLQATYRRKTQRKLCWHLSFRSGQESFGFKNLLELVWPLVYVFHRLTTIDEVVSRRCKLRKTGEQNQIA